MTTAVIIDAVRTPGGRRNGKLQDWHAADLAAHVLKALEERNGLDPDKLDAGNPHVLAKPCLAIDGNDRLRRRGDLPPEIIKQ